MTRTVFDSGSFSRHFASFADDLHLSDDEAKHCAQVLRKHVGDHIILFDGAGNEATAEITSITTKRVDLKILERRETPAPAVSISLIQAIPKGANMEWIIEKAVELGVNDIYPVVTERTVVRLDFNDSSRKQEKWQRVAIEACKQCGQNWLPEVHAPSRFPVMLGTLPVHDLKIIAALQPDSRSLRDILKSAIRSPRSVVVAIGPEGDFSAAEYAIARERGFEPVTLGPLVLRVETAALYAMSVIGHELRGDAGLRPLFPGPSCDEIRA
jgi:16S rRNA (uracil1498-N3)-methyltransferase